MVDATAMQLIAAKIAVNLHAEIAQRGDSVRLVQAASKLEELLARIGVFYTWSDVEQLLTEIVALTMPFISPKRKAEEWLTAIRDMMLRRENQSKR